MTDFKCNCGAKFSVPDNAVGKKGKCPKCNHVVTIEESTTILEWVGYSIAALGLGIVLIGAPILILFTLCMLAVVHFGVFGVAAIGAWVMAAIVCCCVCGIKQGIINWASGTVCAVVGGAALFIVVGLPIALMSGSSSSKEEYRPYKSVVDDVERQQAKFKYIGDGDGF